MHRSALFGCAALAVLLLVAPRAAAEEVLTNNDVVELIKADIDPELVERKIRSSDNDFDVSAGAMVKLRKEGVPDNIIEVMLTRAETLASKRKARLTMQIQYLTSKRPETRQAAFLKLVTMGERARNQLLEVLAGGGDASLRAAVAEALGRMEEKRATPILEVLLDDPAAEVRLAAANALGRLAPDAGGATALAALRDWEDAGPDRALDSYLRLAGRTDEQLAIPYAKAILQERALANDRVEAARALGRLEAENAIDALEGALERDREPAVRGAAAWALGRIGAAGSAGALINTLKAERADRVPIIRALRSFDAETVTPVFISILGAPVTEDETEELLAALRRLTRQDFGPDKARWLKWWDENEAKARRAEEPTTP
ncbi:MAG: HEAT repeat domain-containing protein [Planctomycetota bacterium]